MSQITRLLFAVVALSLLAGCATIINGTSQDVLLRSMPPGATVAIADIQVPTPRKMTLKRWDDYKADFNLDGFPLRSAMIQSGPSFWFFGNLLFGGLIGMIIDVATGGAFSFPNTVEMNLATGKINDDSPLTALAVAPAPASVSDDLAWERYCRQVWPGQPEQFRVCLEHGTPGPAPPATAMPARPNAPSRSEIDPATREAHCRRLWPSYPPQFEICMR
jgi:hypothetical protein